MAGGSKAQASNPGQKTLLSFFKPKDASIKQAGAASRASKTQETAKTRSKIPDHTTNEFEFEEDTQLPPSSPSAKTNASSNKSMAGQNSDVDMESIQDDEEEIYLKPTRLKRKIISVEDNSEPDVEFNMKLSSFKCNESVPQARPSKKRRTSFDSVHTGGSDSLAQSSDEEHGSLNILSDGPSSMVYDLTISDDDEKVRKGATSQKIPAKVSSKPRTSHSNVNTNASGGTGSSFLTAAEKRAQAQKQNLEEYNECYSFLKDIRDKNKIRQGAPGYDPRTLYIPKSAWAQFTPMETQFWEIKQNHYDCVLFFQKGKFYELFQEDAFIGHRVFDLQLTNRIKMTMVGFPETNFNFWASKFLAKGYKVGRVVQAETALGAEMRVAATQGPKDLVRRELQKVLTNGTLVDGDLLMDEQAGHCISIREDGERDFGICILDSSISEFNMSTFTDDVCRTKLETIFRQLRPKEIIFTRGNLSATTNKLLKSIVPGVCQWTILHPTEPYDFESTITKLNEIYPPEANTEMAETESGIPEVIRGMIGNRPVIEALGTMMWYLAQLNIADEILSMKNFHIYDPMRRDRGLVLDGQTLAHIEVLLNSESSDEGSLLQLLSRCTTPFGRRLFRTWLCMPLSEVKAINERLDSVEILMNHPSFEGQFNKITKTLPDLERIVSRIHARSCKVKDFIKALDAFKRLDQAFIDLADTASFSSSESICRLLKKAPELAERIANLESQFIEVDDDSNVLKPQPGKDESYDSAEKEVRQIEAKLDNALSALEEKVGGSLSYWHSGVRYNDIYFVQVPTGKGGKKGSNVKVHYNIPPSWIRHSENQAVVRYTVPKLASLIRSLKEARENRNTITQDFKLQVYALFDTDRDIWLSAVKVMAELDCLFSLAKSSVALGEPNCRPEFVDSDSAFVDFEQLRHPALMLREKDFIPNDVRMGTGAGSARITLLTGPNMGGKSTLMRMTATGVIMAQLGMYVPAAKARLSPIDSILTRMGAYDNMFHNASTFKVEMDECCKILRDATPRSLVILDELGRGTSTFDGMAIASAVLHQLATHTLALTCFATHYSTLTDDFAYHPEIRTMHMDTAIDDERRELIFLYKLVPGIASSSFGTHVAQLAGVPIDVVKKAESISIEFAKRFKSQMDKKKKTSTLSLFAQADFAFLSKVTMGGVVALSEHPVRRKQVLGIIKKAVGAYTEL